MKNKLMLLTAASAFSMAGIAADYTNIVLINLDDVGYGDFSFNGAYGYTTPNIDKMAAEGVSFYTLSWRDSRSVERLVPAC